MKLIETLKKLIIELNIFNFIIDKFNIQVYNLPIIYLEVEKQWIINLKKC